MSEMSYGQSLRSAFTFPFQAKETRTHLILGLAMAFASIVIPFIPSIFIFGYMVEVMRLAVNGGPMVLPEWKDWGQLFKNGLKGLGIYLVFLGPGMIVFITGFLIYIVSIVGTIAISVDSPNGELSPAYSLALMGSVAILFLSMCLSSILLLAGAIPLPAAFNHFVARDKMSAAFHVREWWAIMRADTLGYFIAWVVFIGLGGMLYMGFMIAYMTYILCVPAYLIMIPIGFIIMLITAAVFGQTYREGSKRLSEKAATTE